MVIQESTHIIENKMSNCSVSMSYNFLALIGDEYFYRFVEKQAGICVKDYIHPNDVDEFVKICHELPSGEEVRVFLQMRDSKFNYYPVDLFIHNTGKLLGGEPVYDIQIFNINALELRLKNQAVNLHKYRTLLSLYQDYLFDYNVETNEFTIFLYVGIRSTPFLSCTIEEFEEMGTSALTNLHDIAKFNEFIHYVKTAKLDFTASATFPISKEATVSHHYDIHGKTFYKNHQTPIVVGILKANDAEKEHVPYYATSECHDSGTGLLNKRACIEYTNDILNLHDGSKHYMLIIDVDNFKDVNDNYGHLFGDDVLLKIANTLNSSLNSRGICGRFGGDEFYIFTNNICEEFELRNILTAVRKQIYYAYEETMPEFHPTLSIGISLYPDDADNYESLFKLADKCLYIAKDKGRNRFIIYDESKHGDIKESTKTLQRTMTPIEQAEYHGNLIGNLIVQLHKGGIAELDSVLESLLLNFELDGIRIYTGEQPQLSYTAGSYKNIPDIAGLLKENDFISHFNRNHTLCVGQVANFEAKNKVFATRCLDCSIMGFSCYLMQDSLGRDVFIFYDIFNHTVRWNESEKNFLLTISNVIASIL